MKLNNVLLLICLTAFISCGDEEVDLKCLPTNLQKDIIAIYPFSNGSLNDLSGDSHNLTNSTNAQPTSDRNGNADCAFLFNNRMVNNEFLTRSDADFLNDLDVFSISIWYEPQDTSNLGSMHSTLVGRGENVKCEERKGEWSVGIYDCKRALFSHNTHIWAHPVTNFVDGCEGEVQELSDKWHHVVAAKNFNTYKLYFDGVLQDSIVENKGCGESLIENPGALFLGTNYTGKIDDVIIYERELTQNEVTTLYDLDTCCE